MLMFGGRARPQSIAVVEMDGAIGPRLKSLEYVKLFRALQENNNVRAVVLDVDSPGGSATGSNHLYLAVQALARRKTVVAFIRGLGASGSYLFSCPAEKIVAIPSAIIGSIGVIAMRPLVYEAMEKIGVQMHTTKSDTLKDSGSMFRPATPEEEKKEQELVDDLYQQFLEAVSEGRKMTMDQVKTLATGEVFTGRRARELGLVDETGDLERAIDIAAELSGAQRKPVWVHPKRGLRDVIQGLTGGGLAGEVAAQLDERLQPKYYFQHLP
jgi:protease-4